jgi:hypothetical protein
VLPKSRAVHVAVALLLAGLATMASETPGIELLASLLPHEEPWNRPLPSMAPSRRSIHNGERRSPGKR